MKMRFKTEKRAREETIGRAYDMARAAAGEQRQFSATEARKVEALLATAEALRLGSDIPRDPRGLLTWLEQPAAPARRRGAKRGIDNADK
jgi:hypothetical protein